MKEFVNSFESLNKPTLDTNTSRGYMYAPYQIDIKGYNSVIFVSNDTSIFIQNGGFSIYAGNNLKIDGNENEIINNNVINIIMSYSNSNPYSIGVIKKKYI